MNPQSDGSTVTDSLDKATLVNEELKSVFTDEPGPNHHPHYA